MYVVRAKRDGGDDGAVEEVPLLPGYVVEIRQRQPCLDHADDHYGVAQVALAAES